MARPREFDEAVVLDRALDAFWARGYDATSVEDLVEATGLGRASLYGAFGDKEQLFKKVVSHYLERTDLEAEEATKNLPPKDAIRAFLVQRLAGACSKQGPKGCFLQLSATTGTSAQLVKQAAEQGSKHVRTWLLRQIKAAQASGEVAAGADAASLADFLLVMLNGLSASARAGLPERALKAATEETLLRIFEAG